MKYYYVTDEVLESHSVEAVHVDEICKNLARRGNLVILYAPAAKTFRPSGNYEVRRTGKYFSLFFQLRRDIRADRPDVIYARHNLFLFVPALIGKTFHIPLVLEVNGRLLEETPHTDQSATSRILLALGILRRLESWSINAAKKIIVVTPGIKNDLVRKYRLNPNTIEIIPNGVDIDLLKPVERKIARGKTGLDDEHFYIGYIGSFYPWQGLRYIIEAAALVANRRKEVKFLLIGKGNDLPYLQNSIGRGGLGQHVEIMAPIPHERVPEYINSFDICLCYPTNFRGGATSPFKVYEYLACGRPVIVSEIEGMRAEFGDAVVYAQPESPEALAEAITSLMDDQTLRKKMAAAGRAFVEKGHTWEKTAERIDLLCRQLSAEES